MPENFSFSWAMPQCCSRQEIYLYDRSLGSRILYASLMKHLTGKKNQSQGPRLHHSEWTTSRAAVIAPRFPYSFLSCLEGQTFSYCLVPWKLDRYCLMYTALSTLQNMLSKYMNLFPYSWPFMVWFYMLGAPVLIVSLYSLATNFFPF